MTQRDKEKLEEIKSEFEKIKSEFEDLDDLKRGTQVYEILQGIEQILGLLETALEEDIGEGEKND